MSNAGAPGHKSEENKDAEHDSCPDSKTSDSSRDVEEKVRALSRQEWPQTCPSDASSYLGQMVTYNQTWKCYGGGGCLFVDVP